MKWLVFAVMSLLMAVSAKNAFAKGKESTITIVERGALEELDCRAVEEDARSRCSQVISMTSRICTSEEKRNAGACCAVQVTCVDPESY